jgi:hypothetical protein
LLIAGSTKPTDGGIGAQTAGSRSIIADVLVCALEVGADSDFDRANSLARCRTPMIPCACEGHDAGMPNAAI